MPIKFRCSYCRQFLGISRGRAGEIVDCPTCGRSIRVPGLDGAVQPVPTPELNLRDAKLIRALDELANWNAPQPVAVASAATEEPEAEEEIPQPIAEPIPIEVPIAPEPIAVKPPPSVEPLSAGPQTATADAAAEPAMSVAAALVELNQIPVADPARPQLAAATYPVYEQRRKISTPAVLACALLLALASFAGGYFISRARQPVADTNAAGERQPASEQEIVLIPAISGRITYKTADGGSLPDRGARVLVLPRERDGTAKLSAAGFRAGDHPTDVRFATAALRALGGDLAIADDGGKFTLQLANPGTFHIVVISNYANRADSDEIDPELIRVLTPYFDQPSQIIGRTKVHFGQVRYKGTGTEIWDHSF
jgi:hypothetical protein